MSVSTVIGTTTKINDCHRFPPPGKFNSEFSPEKLQRDPQKRKGLSSNNPFSGANRELFTFRGIAEQWTKPRLVGLYRVWNTTYPVIFPDYFISHEIRIPEAEPTSISSFMSGRWVLLPLFSWMPVEVRHVVSGAVVRLRALGDASLVRIVGRPKAWWENREGPCNGEVWTSIAGVWFDPQNSHFWVW